MLGLGILQFCSPLNNINSILKQANNTRLFQFSLDFLSVYIKYVVVGDEEMVVVVVDGAEEEQTPQEPRVV